MIKAARAIISRLMVKPSSPTPSHLQTYNLSEFDKCINHNYMPVILYYPNNEISSLTLDDKVRKMKKSLSLSLTRHYPFSGRIHTPSSSYIDCNDEGAVFVEAKYNSQMNMMQHISEDDDSVSQLFVDGMFWENTPKGASLLGVQVNHFACGGLAVAVSMSHRIGDGCTLGTFLGHWASVARYGSIDHKEVLPFDPHFLQFPSTPDFDSPKIAALPNVVNRMFMFPNSKLNDLKNKVLAMAGGESTLSINNPTRVEVLTSLLYKTAVAAITPRSSSFKPSYLITTANIRNRFVPKLPQTTVGNFTGGMLVTSRHESETSLSVLVSKIRKQKTELDQIQNMQLALQHFNSIMSTIRNEDLENVVKRCFVVSSLCGFPFNKVDFGWGNPTIASVTLRSANRTGSILMDPPNGDGIEAWVSLDAQDMERFENDKELLSYCQN